MFSFNKIIKRLDMENEKQMITINCYFTAENVSTAADTLNFKSTWLRIIFPLVFYLCCTIRTQKNQRVER